MVKYFVILSFCVISTVFPANIEYDLYSGWNLISIPCETEYSSFDEFIPGYISAFTWDADNYTYKYTDNVPKPNIGIWLMVSSDVSFELECGSFARRIHDEVFISPILSAGKGHSMALANDGTVYSWGQNNQGQIGDGTTLDTFLPEIVRGIPAAKYIACGAEYSVMISTIGESWGWGDNEYGYLGDGTFSDRAEPVRALSPDGSSFINGLSTISSGGAHTVALADNGTVWAWGLNAFFELGDASPMHRTIPVQVLDSEGDGYLSDIIQANCCSYHTACLASDGTVWNFGRNDWGQIGDGTEIIKTLPVKVKNTDGTGNLSNIVQLSSRCPNTLALDSDGHVWSWGLNDFGQLGNGTNANQSLPNYVIGIDGIGILDNVKQISAGRRHTLALLNNGKVVAWGSNEFGQLGNNTTEDSYIPGYVLNETGSAPLENIIHVCTGRKHSMVITEDGRILTWGLNDRGQLGDNTTSNRYLPVHVLNPDGSGNLNLFDT